jgi:hypothetical protein
MRTSENTASIGLVRLKIVRLGSYTSVIPGKLTIDVPEKSNTLFPGVALVTGAASGMVHCSRQLPHLMIQGIGSQVAISFAIEGCRRLALFDKDSTGLNATKAAVKTVSRNADPDVFIRHVDNLDTYEVG